MLKIEVGIAKDSKRGSRIQHSSKRWATVTFYDDMVDCFLEIDRVLKSGRHIVVVMGDSVVTGKKFDGLGMITRISKITGFMVMDHDVCKIYSINKLFSKSFRTTEKRSIW